MGRCHGGIFAQVIRGVTFEDLHITNFRYSGLLASLHPGSSIAATGICVIQYSDI